MSDITALLGLRKRPVAISFLDAPPDGIAPWQGGAMPAGCAFWRKAQEGETFYTVPSDHYNCAVGAHTHGIGLPADRADELGQTVGFMVQNSYIRMEEVPGIPTLSSTPAAIAYGPADGFPMEPDIILVAAQPAQAMILVEAAVRAGANEAAATLGRPACAVLPQTVNSASVSLSLGCKGNRTFTRLADDEMYVSVPGSKWNDVVTELSAILAANQTMACYYTAHEERFVQA